MRLISKKTYRRYMRAINVLMDLQPKPGTKNAKRLLSLAESVEAYERVNYPLNPSPMKKSQAV